MSHYQKLTIKEWAIEDRPREKLLSKGISTLSDAELIAILIGSGSSKESAVELSRKILGDYQNNLALLGKCTVDDLVGRYHGIGEAKAVSIVSALEVGRRRSRQEVVVRPQIASSRDAYDILGPSLADLPHEEFWVLMLNRSNKVIGQTRISMGGIVGTVIDVRLIMKKALEQLATSLIVCHNHPSGSIQPSQSDVEISKRLCDAGKVMDIPVLDHLIIGEKSYFSFADEGLI